MNAGTKQVWLDALNTHKQGRGSLRSSEDEYCCLGVLCNVFTQQTGRGEWILDEMYRAYLFSVDGEKQQFYPPKAVMEWAGLSNTNPEVSIEGLYTSLAVANDYPYSFVAISKFIDEQL